MDHPLEQSIESLNKSVQLLQKTVNALQKKSDKSRLLANTLLKCKPVFELVSEYDIQKARLDLMEEVEPVVNRLIITLEKSLNKLEREKSTLTQTFELNKLRINNRNEKSDPVVMVSSTNEELEILKKLKERKLHLQEQIRQIKNSTTS